MNKTFLSIITILLFGACASHKIPKSVLSEPDWKESPISENEKRITISAINYFNSSLAPQAENYNQLGTIKVGGIQLLKKYSSILRDRLKNQVLLLSTGDIINENQSGGVDAILKDFESLGVDAFQLSEKEIKKISPKAIDKTRNKFINSNIIVLKKQAPLTSKNIDNFMIKVINGVKVGIMSVTTFKNTEARKQKYLNGLYFEDPIYSVLKVHEQLKRRGAKVFVLMIKTHKDCPEKKCDSTRDELENFLKRLPPNKVDIIVGSEPELIHENINGIPFIQNSGEGKYLSRVDLFYNTKEEKIKTSKTYIHTPIKLCSEFFKATKDCHIENDYYKNAKIELIKDSDIQMSKARFLGKEI